MKFNSNSVCEYCNKLRAHADHTKCSKKRKRDVEARKRSEELAVLRSVPEKRISEG